MNLPVKSNLGNNPTHLSPHHGFSSVIGRSESRAPVFQSFPPLKTPSLQIKAGRVSKDAVQHLVGVEVEDESDDKKKVVIHGTVVLMKKTVLGFNPPVLHDSVLDRVHEILGNKVSLQLVSAVNADPDNGMRGKLSKAAYLEGWITKFGGLKSEESAFKIEFEWDKDMGLPGAFIIRNEHHTQFYLKSVTLNGVPDHDRVHFLCNSWVYPAHRYKNDRVFFSNKTYLPHETPKPLRVYRAEELQTLRGNGEGKLEEWDRVYDYACYNDLGDPDSGLKYVRPILGGSMKLPYPRRGRTGRAPTKTDPRCESRLPLATSMNVYVPRDERFGHLKLADVLSQSLKSVAHALQAALGASFDNTPSEFGSFEDALKIYEEGIKANDETLLEDRTFFEKWRKLFHIDGVPRFKFPLPDIIKEDKSAWRSDEEFARQMVAGVNPVVIRRLEDFPPVSKLNPAVYGNQDSSISKDHIEVYLNGLTVDQAIEKNRLFILDHHDTLMPYLRQINTTSTKTYATRTILFLKDDGTLKPLAIELSLPHPDGDQLGAVSKVYRSSEDGVEASIWQLAKAYVSVNDSGYHQLISHWLHTHAVIEPFIIATNRQLSVLHPIHKLLHPHFRDTMNINALARQILIGADGIFEKTVFPRKYALEMSSVLYKNWVFTDQALPKDLLKRGMTINDPKSPHGYKLLIQDYPYAVDGLDIWSAIESWVTDYCYLYYTNDQTVINDTELQNWWREIKEEGHGDLKNQPWWPEMKTTQDLTQICTTIIWVASALHAALNFGQYPYGGYLPNRPTVSRRLMPEPNTLEYEELKTNPEMGFLKTVTNRFETLLGISVIEILSVHFSDEVYLGERECDEWSEESGVWEVIEKFRKRLKEVEERIMERNTSGKWKNREGLVNVPYTLLVPSSERGVTARGIPNSISI